MPIFEYRCPKCEEEEEHIVKHPDDVIECKECGEKMVKLLSGKVTFRLYGEGFHNRSHKDTGDLS